MPQNNNEGQIERVKHLEEILCSNFVLIIIIKYLNISLNWALVVTVAALLVLTCYYYWERICKPVLENLLSLGRQVEDEEIEAQLIEQKKITNQEEQSQRIKKNEEILYSNVIILIIIKYLHISPDWILVVITAALLTLTIYYWLNSSEEAVSEDLIRLDKRVEQEEIKDLLEEQERLKNKKQNIAVHINDNKKAFLITDFGDKEPREKYYLLSPQKLPVEITSTKKEPSHSWLQRVDNNLITEFALYPQQLKEVSKANLENDIKNILEDERYHNVLWFDSKDDLIYKMNVIKYQNDTKYGLDSNRDEFFCYGQAETLESLADQGFISSAGSSVKKSE